MRSILFACSGELGYKTLVSTNSGTPISGILTDKKSVSIQAYAVDNNIPIFIGNPRSEKIDQFINSNFFDLLISVNYLFLFNKILLNKFSLAINFHGSLLPKYRGRTPHVWAIINGEKECGITAHIIDEECDSGDIVLQEKIEIEQNDTGGTILSKYFEMYPQIVNRVILKIKSGKIERIKQDHSKATCFPKRTSDDGIINWNWQKERIYNWVRAQTKPYPGAFSLICNIKIIIYKISFSSLGYNGEMQNGLILRIQNDIITVKTPNGCIDILDYVIEGKLDNLNEGIIFQ